jgi:protoheme IX farnesyltransferase
MENKVQQSGSFRLAAKVKDYFLLVKFTLSFTVVFSCVICFLLGPGNSFDWKMISLLFLAGMLVTGSANALNQAAEKETDALMKRTAKRPVASGRMSVQEANMFALCTGFAGVWLMYYYFNATSALLSAISLFLYAFIYTPLKKVSAISVFVGAFPGAFPCLIGWVASFYDQPVVWTGGLILFAIQFIWQFPHFWAIAWVAHEDYGKAGFKLLPNQSAPTKSTALQAVLYSMLMIPIGLLPFFRMGELAPMSGKHGFAIWIVLAGNLFMVWQCIRLYQQMDKKAALRVMFSSYIYLPIILLALLADKM